MRSHHWTIPVAYDRDGALGALYGVAICPLVELARRGEHAASDYLEDALFAGVPAVGARRCGGGLAGRPFVTNAAEPSLIWKGILTPGEGRSGSI